MLILDLSPYKNSHSHALLICNVCLQPFRTTPSSLRTCLVLGNQSKNCLIWNGRTTTTEESEKLWIEYCQLNQSKNEMETVASQMLDTWGTQLNKLRFYNRSADTWESFLLNLQMRKQEPNRSGFNTLTIIIEIRSKWFVDNLAAWSMMD